jgi:hypothetical protein
LTPASDAALRTAASYDHWMSGEQPLRDEVLSPAEARERLTAAAVAA